MALLHCMSGECINSELDLFSVPLTQTVIEKNGYLEVAPLSAISGSAPLEFFIAGNGDDYVDLNNTMLYLRVKDKITCRTHFLGVLPSDQLPKKPIRILPSACIINTHPARLPGEHWIAVYLTQDGPTCFFDSFGNPPNSHRFPTTINNFLAANDADVLYSNGRVQDYSSDTCGQHCVFFLYHLARGYDYNHVMKLYTDDYIKNDKMVSLFVKRLRPYVCNDKMFSCVHSVQTLGRNNRS